jgi:hypothetical protein
MCTTVAPGRLSAVPSSCCPTRLSFPSPTNLLLDSIYFHQAHSALASPHPSSFSNFIGERAYTCLKSSAFQGAARDPSTSNVELGTFTALSLVLDHHARSRSHTTYTPTDKSHGRPRWTRRKIRSRATSRLSSRARLLAESRLPVSSNLALDKARAT